MDRDDTGRTAHENDYFRIKILTEEGRKYADIEIPYFKGRDNVGAIRARTIRPDGSIADFDGKVFDKSIAKAKGLKYLAKTFTLPDVQVGSIIEYYYTIDLAENFVFDSHWILSDELFTKSARFSLKPYHSDYSPVGVRWSWQGLPPGTVPPAEGGDHVVRLEAGNIPAFQTEDFMPPENEMKSRVDFTYSEDQFERDPGCSGRNRQESQRTTGEFCRKTQGHGTGSGPDCFAHRSAGREIAKDLRPGTAVAQHLLRSQ